MPRVVAKWHEACNFPLDAPEKSIACWTVPVLCASRRRRVLGTELQCPDAPDGLTTKGMCTSSPRGPRSGPGYSHHTNLHTELALLVTGHYCITAHSGMPVVTQQPHENQKSSIRDVSDIPRTATQSCSRCDEVVTIFDNDPVMPQRKRSRLLILILVSISFSLILSFPRALPSWSRLPSFSDVITQMRQILSVTSFSSPASPSNGRTDQVQWDNYSLILHGQRVLI
jgi:hypothetical protein